MGMPETKLTAETITSKQILALQDEAWKHNDGGMSAICSFALRIGDDETIIVRDVEYTHIQARQCCADVINAAADRAFDARQERNTQ